jgi:hypothetical protein
MVIVVYRKRGRKGWAFLMRRFAVYSVFAMMVVTAIPVDAVAPPGSLELPDPEDWGLMAEMTTIQADAGSVIDEQRVVTSANAMLSNVDAYDLVRDPAMGPFELHTSAPPFPTTPDVIDLVDDTPSGFLPDALQLILDRPLEMSIYVESADHENWVQAYLRPSLGSIDRWVFVDVDNDTTTGDGAGNDIRLRMGVVMENRSVNFTIVPPSLTVKVRGGIGMEIERLGADNEDLPIDVTAFKSFRYSGISYTWFLDYEVDRLPERAYMSITAENVNATAETGKLMEVIQSLMDPNGTGPGNGTRVSDITGPYTIAHNSTDQVEVQATLGYIKLGQNPGDDRQFFEEASWLTAIVNRATPEILPPTDFALWLDSPAFNRTFDQLRWTANGPSRLELEYFDARENDTQAKALVDIAPTSLRFKISEADEDVGRVAHIHYQASAPVGLIQFDAWDFAGGNRRQYLHTHVALMDMPINVWLNGTIDVGGQEIATLRPDPRAGNFIPQMLEAIMVGLTSKLFNIGQTLRALPGSLLEMPELEGYMDLQFPDPGAHLGMMEMWLTSDHYATVEEGTSFLAFYNDTHEELLGNMVQSGFSIRFMDLRAMHAEFKDRKQIVLDSRYNREFRGLFIDPANNANASLRFSNIPHNISLELMDDQIVYMGDGTVDRLEYTSEIGDQYIKFQMDGVPGGMNFLLGDETSGLDVLVGEIDTITVLLTDGPLRSMDGDHLLYERDAMGSTAVSLRISGIRTIQSKKGVQNTVSLKTGGEAFGVLIADGMEDFHVKAKIDPIPLNIETEVSDLLGLSDIETPSVQDVTSVLEFASVMYQISDLADSVLEAMSDATVSMVDGLGGFSSNLTFAFEGDKNMDIAATVTHGGPDPVPIAPWAHGVWVNMLPASDGGVLIDAKIFLSGLAPRGAIQLASTPESTHLDLALNGFAPAYDHFVLQVNGSSLIDNGSGKDLWLYLSDLATPIDLDLRLNLDADVSIGGTVVGDLAMNVSNAIGPLHLRSRIRNENLATVEVLLSNVPRSADLSFHYSRDIQLDLDLSEGVDLVYLKVSRDMDSIEAPATSVVLHDVPSLLSLSVANGAGYDMDADSALANLPDVQVTTNAPGLDLLIRLEGRSLGNKADLFIDARNLEELSMTKSGMEYRISAGSMEFIQFSISKLHYSKGTWIDRLDIVATHLTRATLKIHMVFGVYPLIVLDDLVATGLQISLVGRVTIRGGTRDLSLTVFEVPMSLRSAPRSHMNGVSIQESKGEDRIFLPAPMGTLMATAFW